MSAMIDSEGRVIVMLGMHNSGTSLLAKVARQIGVDLGPDALTREQAINTAIYDYWENARITEMQERILLGLDRHWRSGTGALPIPASAWAHPLVSEAREALSAYVSGQLARSPGLWGFKDPRTARLLPLWRKVLAAVGAEPLFLVSVRAPGQTVASFAAKAGVPPAWAEALWMRHYLEILEGTEGAPRCFVDYEEWFTEPQNVVERLSTFLGKGSAADAAALVDASLPRFQDRRAPVSPRAEALYALHRAAAAGDDVSGAVRELQTALDGGMTGRPSATLGLDRDGARTPRLADRPLRACIVTAELAGIDHCGGIGTAAGALALALAEAGHMVTVLHLRLASAMPAPPGYARLGIRIEALPPHLLPGGQRTSGAVASAAFRWLRARSFDVIHHHDWLGTGHFLGAAKRGGIAFGSTTLCCTAHGPTAWIREGNGTTGAPDGVDALESAAIGAADILVSPSAYLLEWMRARGWALPARVAVQQNLLPFPLPLPLPERSPRAALQPPNELVFYGRLEARKGVVLFCDALDRLGSGVAVTFLGTTTATVEGDAAAYVRRRAAERDWRILDTLDRDGALAYLRRPGRLAVIPSLIENSPYTVLECLVEGIPLLASRVGGIPELIAEDDHSAVLFDPTAPALAERLAQVLRHGVPAARPQVDPAAHRAAWIDWHTRLPRAGADEPPLWSATGEDAPAHGAVLAAGAAAQRPTTADAEALTLPGGALPIGAERFYLWARVRTVAVGDIVRVRLTGTDGRAAFLAETPINAGAGEWFVCQEVTRPEGLWPPGRYWAEWAVTSPAAGWSNALSRWLTMPAGANG